MAMKQHEFIPQHQAGKERTRHFRAFIASCIFHGFLICLLLGLTFIYWTHLQPFKNGSPHGGQSVSLPTLVIVSPPPEISHPTQISAPSPHVAPPEQQVAQRLSVPENGVPVLSHQPIEIPKKEAAKSNEPHRQASSHTPAIAEATPVHTKALASAPPSSYMPGDSVLPHPPYPAEARDRGQTGTVTVSVEFDAQGGVAETRVVQSSGVPLLDSKTRSFIRDHWHSVAYAGHTVSVPIQYTLENL